MSTPPKALFCPTCRKVVLATAEDFPFCSDRCRILDLGKWASGDYKISSPILDPEVLEGLDQSMSPRRHQEDED
jgi:endogenous inhibitor of DNA gyrase (YacG/DUF329 family)